MRQTQLFTKTRKEAPQDEVSANAKLLIRGGYIHKTIAGVYSLLPLGLRVMNKINSIIRKEMNALGGQEVFLSSLQDPEIWKKTGRWDDATMDNWFKTALKNKAEVGLATTHEEPLTVLMRDHISSYRDLPQYVYQIQTKFRNEARAKSGLMRGREFLMKDLYSFTATEDELNDFYEKTKVAYMNIFNAVGIGDQTYLTFASGGAFSKFSHEFQTLCASGEDTIHLSADKKIAINSEVMDESVLKELGLDKKDLQEVKAIEVGNIFKLGTRFSQALGLNFVDANEVNKPVIMGSYGIGPGRLMATVAELHSDEKGLAWPEAIAPFKVHLLCLTPEKEDVRKETDKLYDALVKADVEVLYDDRSVSAGTKFAEADLIGIPMRVVVSEKTLAQQSVELKHRTETEVKLISLTDAVRQLVAK
jgi:prolyl-tRNA synthetase